jgi:alkaline phosphatase
MALRGVQNYTWTPFSGPDVFYGAGAEQFIAGSGSFQGKDYYREFANAGYSVSLNKTSLLKASNTTKSLGIFCTSNLPVWLDRNVYTGCKYIFICVMYFAQISKLQKGRVRAMLKAWLYISFSCP